MAEECSDRQTARFIEIINRKDLWHDIHALVEHLQSKGLYSKTSACTRDAKFSCGRYVSMLRLLEEKLRKELDASRQEENGASGS